MWAEMVGIAMATFASEDATVIGTGVLVASGQLGFVEGASACFAGILIGDLVLYAGGRCGSSLVGRVPEHRLAKAKAWLTKRGAMVVLISRFVPGMRLPVFVAAGLLRSRFSTFAAYFAVASAVWTVLVVGGIATVGTWWR